MFVEEISNGFGTLLTKSLYLQHTAKTSRDFLCLADFLFTNVAFVLNHVCWLIPPFLKEVPRIFEGRRI